MVSHHTWMPSQVILFSGHQIDRPDRPAPRFPREREAVAWEAIAEAITDIGAGSSGLGLCSGAAGGDLLFAEACLVGGMHLEIRLPFDEPTFLETSVTPAGRHWQERYVAVTRHPHARVLVMPDWLGPTPVGDNPYARCNRWMLDDALSYGHDHTYVLVLWDGQAGDGPGGTWDFVAAARARGLKLTILDTRELFL